VLKESSTLKSQALYDLSKRRLLPEDPSYQQVRCENGKSCIVSVLLYEITLSQSIMSTDNFSLYNTVS